MNPSRSGRQLAGCLVVCLFALTLVGCARQFTREHFNMIQAGVDDQEDVERILGKPEFVAQDVWFYEDTDRHHNAQVFFDEQGRVAGKEWMDANTGDWDGTNPFADQPPRGEVRERHTKTRTIDDD